MVDVTAEAASVVTTGAAVLAAGAAAAALKVTARGMAAPITAIRFHFIT